ncbi:MAG: hypothetical protein OXB84_06570 [Halobacteriovoraceae bacterium]|nr:hypothetical protein [Halobacteriovoraceae bacterium]
MMNFWNMMVHYSWSKQGSVLLGIVTLFFLITFNSHAIEDKECIDSIFTTEINHKAWPFGLTENKLHISKDKCQIVINHEKLKFIKKRWAIDVCRGPVHIKSGRNSEDVIKKEQECFDPQTTNEFCQELALIRKIMQDDGLIYANGEKEDMESDHGRVYCSYRLLQVYLEDGVVLNRNKDYENILRESTFPPDKALEEKKESENKEEEIPKGKTGEF